MTKKKLLILIVLYLSFVSLGLPDQILGIAWPSMQSDFQKPLDAVGVLVFIISILTAFSGFFSGFILQKYKILTVLIASSCLTAFGLFGWALAGHWYVLVFCAIPIGLGAGTVDAGLNSYVAENYPARHMNWLHGCWGIGATMGPAVMTGVLGFGHSWRWGIVIVASIQTFLILTFILSGPLWEDLSLKKEEEEILSHHSKQKLLSLPVFLSISLFVFYTALESSVGLWFYTVMVEHYKIETAVAGASIVGFWASLTVGRFVIGCVADRLGNRRVILCSLLISLYGLAMLLFGEVILLQTGLCMAGFGFSAIYPSMMHETPVRFGKILGKTVTGFQAGAAAMGVAVLTPSIGILIAKIGLEFLIPLLIMVAIIMFIVHVVLNKMTPPLRTALKNAGC